MKRIHGILVVKAKNDAFKNFEKPKSRLVACGKHQLGGSGGTSSPTVSLNTMLTMLAEMQVVDVTGAYLNAELKAPEYMRLGKQITGMLVESKPELRNCSSSDGTIVVEL